MKDWLAYAAAGLVLMLAVAGLAALFGSAPAARAIWFGAGVAYAVQLVAFAGLVSVRERSDLFMIGWLSGMVLRFGVVGVVAFWVSRGAVFAVAPALMSLVACVFVLLLLEPLFLRRSLQTR